MESIELTAQELWTIRTAVAKSAPRDVEDMAARIRLLDWLEFTDAEKAAIGWQKEVGPDGNDRFRYNGRAVLAREFSDRRRRACLHLLETAVGMFPMDTCRDVVFPALTKLGWLPPEEADDE